MHIQCIGPAAEENIARYRRARKDVHECVGVTIHNGCDVTGDSRATQDIE